MSAARLPPLNRALHNRSAQMSNMLQEYGDMHRCTGNYKKDGGRIDV